VQPWHSLAHRTHADLEATEMNLRLDTLSASAFSMQVGCACKGMRLLVSPTLTALVIAMKPLIATMLSAVWL